MALVLWVPSYNRTEPALGGVPFFYWFRLRLDSRRIGARVHRLSARDEGDRRDAARRRACQPRCHGGCALTLNLPATIVFVTLFALVTWLGFVAAHWRKADLNQLHEWGLGGRRFGTVVTWFLLGGDLYTAYTFIAVPALVFGAGAFGFFAVPYTILIYPFLYLVFPRLWAIARERGHVTAADFVRDRFDSRILALAVALTGIIATMPYIALQLIGMEVVIGALRLPDQRLCRASAAYHRLHRARRLHLYQRASRAGADCRGQGHADLCHSSSLPWSSSRRSSEGMARSSPPCRRRSCSCLRRRSRISASKVPYATLALGLALALFLYPHAMTGILSASSGDVIRRNAGLLAAYSFILGLIAALRLHGDCSRSR